MAYIVDNEGTQIDLSFLSNSEFMTLGTASSCDVRLPSGKNLARTHCRIININGWFYIQPISNNSVLINNIRVNEKEHMLKNADRIQLGELMFTFYDEATADLDTYVPQSQEQTAETIMEGLKQRIRSLLMEQMDLRKINTTSGDAADELKKKARVQIGRIIEGIMPEIKAANIDPQELKRQSIQDILGYGPLDDLINDDSITEIMCFGKNKIYIERNGKLEKINKKFTNTQQLLGIIERIVGPLGRRIDESSPLVDARLPDGSRVNAVISPIAIDGPSLDIRKFSKRAFAAEDYIKFGSASHEIIEFLKLAVKWRQNIIISGGTGSGKTTLLNLVSAFIPEDERIVTIEDSAELKLQQEHVVRLESRPPNIEGRGEITIRTLVRNALRMRPDRIIVGECRGGEALDMLQAMNTGHDGSLTTLHANSPADVIGRLETLVLMAGMELPVRAIRQQIASAVNLICHQARLVDGSRKIVSIAELVPAQNEEQFSLSEIFVFQQTGFDDHGRVQGYFTATGVIPQFVHKLKARGIDVNFNLFKKVQQT